ncbi:MAG: ethanolamine utilization protein EutJ [Firmicutes bacterium]|nr:ethanolamine utilization protein EutJ [Bacillota bacterium]
MQHLQRANELVKIFEDRIASPLTINKNQKLYTGVDLGTAYIVIAVVDKNGSPVAGAMQFAQVVKDGLVVDYIGALDIVKKLKAQIETSIGRELELAAAAYPPGTEKGIQKTMTYIIEGAGMEVKNMIDEPSAANNVLNVKDGAVVDIGGGTTGTAIIKNGKVIHIDDEPTGGTHLSLVIAGSYNIDFQEAEKIKKDPARHEELLPIVKPVMKKIGSIVRNHITNYDVDTIYLVGGSSCFKGINKVIEKEVGLQVCLPANPFLVTPLGIALSVTVEGSAAEKSGVME